MNSPYDVASYKRQYDNIKGARCSADTAKAARITESMLDYPEDGVLAVHFILNNGQRVIVRPLSPLRRQMREDDRKARQRFIPTMNLDGTTNLETATRLRQRPGEVRGGLPLGRPIRRRGPETGGGMTDREKAAARIRALRNMTIENGCSEAEAMLAAQKLAEALRDYNMTLDEADLRASPFAEETHAGAGSVGLKLWKVAGAIGVLTGAKQWRDGTNAALITFLGFKHEVEVASYMLRLCERAMHTEVAAYMRGTERWPMGRRAARLVPFLDGMADRLRQRILAMLPPSQAGRGLIVLRGALIDAEAERRGHKLETNMARRSLRGASYGAGVAAGERVALNKGLEGSTDDKARLR